MSGFCPSWERRDPSSFSAFHALCATTVFEKTRAVRMQLFHRGPNQPAPCSDAKPCDLCSELHGDVMLKVFPKWAECVAQGTDPVALVRRTAGDRAKDIFFRERQTALGRVAKVSAVLQAKWVIDALPLEDERVVLGLMLHHARSDDAPEVGSDWPERRFGDKTGLGVAEVHRLVREIPVRLGAISRARAEWVQDNIIDALADHQARCDIECFEGQPAGWEPVSTDPGPEGEAIATFAPSDPIPEEWAEDENATVHTLETRFHEWVLKGKQPAVALRLAASEVLPETAAKRLCEVPELSQLAGDLWAS